MFGSSFQLCRVFGIPIRLHSSLVLLMGLIWYDFLSSGENFLFNLFVGGLYAFLLLLSIVLHELGHSLAAMRFGCRVRAITLMVFGGRAELSHIPTKPAQEFVVAIAGPLVSMLLWLGGTHGSAFLGKYISDSTFAGDVLIGAPAMLGLMNFYLFVFNLIPAFPMDGGRILRAALAHRLGRLRATQIAATLGRVLAMAGIAWVLVKEPFSMSTIFQILLALYIFQIAGQECQMVQMESFYARNDPFAYKTPPPDVYVSPPPYERPKPARRWYHIFRKDDDAE